MKTLNIFSFLIFFISACNSQEVKTVVTENKIVVSEAKLKQSEILNGFWLTNDYLEKIKQTKSIYSNQNYNTKWFGFTLKKDNLLSDSSILSGFLIHEGGYVSPIIFDDKKGKFVHDLQRLSEFGDSPEPFELNLKNDTILEVYFPKENKTETYKKVIDDQVELRKILFEGIYQSAKFLTEIKMDRKGNISDFDKYQYYEVIYDFGEGIEYDAIILFKNKEETNWSDGTIFKFRFDSDTLNLYHVKTNWDDLNHQVSDTSIKLIRR